MPVLAQVVEPAIGGLQRRIFQALGAGPARQAGDDFLADGDLLEDKPKVFAGRIALGRIVDQFAGEQGHGRQRRAEFVGGAGGQRAHGNDPFIAQPLFAGGGQFGVALANDAGGMNDDPADHDGRDDENQPHAAQVQARRARGVGHRQRDVIEHEQRVGGNGDGGDDGHATRRQGQRGDGDRRQKQGNERIGSAAAEEDDGAQHADVEQQLAEQFVGRGGLRADYPPLRYRVEQQGDGDDAEERYLWHGNVEQAGADHDELGQHGEHHPATDNQAAQVGQVVGIRSRARGKCHGPNYA